MGQCTDLTNLRRRIITAPGAIGTKGSPTVSIGLHSTVVSGLKSDRHLEGFSCYGSVDNETNTKVIRRNEFTYIRFFVDLA